MVMFGPVFGMSKKPVQVFFSMRMSNIHVQSIKVWAIKDTRSHLLQYVNVKDTRSRLLQYVNVKDIRSRLLQYVNVNDTRSRLLQYLNVKDTCAVY